MAPCFFDEFTQAFFYFGRLLSLTSVAVAIKFFMSQHRQRRPLLHHVYRGRIALLSIQLVGELRGPLRLRAVAGAWTFFIFIVSLTPHIVFKVDLYPACSTVPQHCSVATSCYSNLPTCRGLHKQSSGVKCHARRTTGKACMHADRYTQVRSASWDGAGIGTFWLSTPLVDWNILGCWCFWFHLFATSHNSTLVFSQFVMVVLQSDLPSDHFFFFLPGDGSRFQGKHVLVLQSEILENDFIFNDSVPFPTPKRILNLFS